MKKLWALSLVFAFGAAALGQTPLKSSQPDRIEFGLLAADAAVRALDAATTLHVDNEPGRREQLLPQSFIQHPALMWSYSMGEVGVQYLAALYLTRHGHPRVAKIVTGADVVFDGYSGLHNFTIWNPPNPYAGAF